MLWTKVASAIGRVNTLNYTVPILVFSVVGKSVCAKHTKRKCLMGDFELELQPYLSNKHFCEKKPFALGNMIKTLIIENAHVVVIVDKL